MNAAIRRTLLLIRTICLCLAAALAIVAAVPKVAADTGAGSVIAWGYNYNGQTNVPAALTGVAAISEGEGYSMALRSDGTVFAWGDNGNGTTNVPPGLSNVIAISAASHGMALKNDGTVVSWGYNNYGQTNVPPGLSGVVAIAAGTLHSMALKNDGTMIAWGDNSSGQTSVPAGLSGVVAIAGSQWNSMVLKNNGTVMVWGGTGSGLTTVPAGLTNVIAIGVGPYACMALKGNGTVVAWGDNNYGQLNIPAGLTNVVAIGVASQHSAALKSDGTVVVWGNNNYGELNIPAGLSGVVAMSARNLDTMALTPYGPAVTSGPVLPSGLVGSGYNQTLQAAGGTAPYSWGITSGQLPAGLSLSSSGTLSGMPAAMGLACFRVRATGANGLATDKDFALTIGQSPTITTSSPLPSGAVSVVYSWILTASGGATPYTWSLSAGSLPTGLNLSSAGLISGTPSVETTASFVIQVTSNDGFSSTSNFSLTINANPSLPTTNIISGVTLNYDGAYMVGTNGGYNGLIVTNAGILTSGNGVIGNSVISDNNYALVTGAGSVWSNSGSFFVGGTGSFNQLQITNGGWVVSSNGYVGYDANANANAALVTGAGSVWSNSSSLYVGNGGAGNSLTIASSGTVIASNVIIGSTPSTGDVITIAAGWLYATNFTGSGALNVNYGALNLNSGMVTVNQFFATNFVNSVVNFNGGTLNSGGTLINNSAAFIVGDTGSGATFNLLGGTHSFGSNLVVGNSGAGNGLVITNGAQVFVNGSTCVGGAASASNNFVLITGAGSLWSNNSTLVVGSSGFGNTVIITNGGQVFDTVSATLGDTSSANNNAVIVTGSNSFWRGGNDLVVGNGGSYNQVTIANGGMVSDGNGWYGNLYGANSNAVVVTGAGSVWSNSGNLNIGRDGSGNSLVVTNGGVVKDATGYVGLYGGADNNTILVSGANSLWSNSGDLYVGNGSSGNQLIINGGAVVSSARGSVGNFGANDVQNNNSVLVDGAGSAWINTNGSLYVARRGSGSSVTIRNGGLVSASSFAEGTEAEGDNNFLTIDGVNSKLITTSSDFLIGGFGSGNTLLITNGGALLSASNSWLGMQNRANNNSATVIGTGSVWSSAGSLAVGSSGSGNTLTIANGGVVSDRTASLGNNNTAYNNAVLVTDPGSLWSNSASLIIGYGGSANTLTIANGGAVIAPYMAIGVAAYDIVNVSGGCLYAANAAGTGMLYVVYGALNLNSGTVTANQLLVGSGRFYFNGGTLNSGGSTANGSTFRVGNGASAATLDLFGGAHSFANGLVINTNATLTGTGSIIGSITDAGLIAPGNGFGVITDNGNLTMLTGSAATMELGGTDAWLYDQLNLTGTLSFNGALNVSLVNGFTPRVGDRFNLFGFGNDSGAFSQINLPALPAGLYWNTNQLYSSGVISAGFDIVGAMTNVTVINGFASNYPGVYTVGDNSALNGLIVTNAGVLASGSGVIGNSAAASGNAAWVTGAGAVWSNSGAFYAGATGSFNKLAITSGGRVMNTDGYVGYDTNAGNNAVLVTDAGSVWSNRGGLAVGGSGSSNSLVIACGGIVTATNVVVGSNPSTGNFITVAGGVLSVTNGGLNLNYGAFNLSSGTVTVGQLVATNGANSIVNFYGGTLNSGGSTVNNGSIFQVGDGTDVAILDLFGGAHSFANGLLINTNAILVGTGAITGPVTDAGLIAPGSSGAIGVITDNGSLTMLDGGAMNLKLAGSSPALYDQFDLTGALTFGGTLNVSLVNGYSPQAGDQFNLFSFGAATGVFSQVNLPALSPWVHWNSSQIYTSGMIFADANSVTVLSGLNSNYPGSYVVGSNSPFNALIVTNAGVLASGSGVIGLAAGGNSNCVLVTGAGSVWSNNAFLYVGNSGSFNNLTIANAGQVFCNNGFIGLSGNSNAATVTGAGSIWSNSGSTWVGGASGAGNSMVITNGGRVFDAGGGFVGPSNSLVVVAGTGSLWSNGGTLDVGNGGGGNSVAIANGGQVISGGGFIGDSGSATNNSITVSGPGSIWRNNGELDIGIYGYSNSLTIANGGQVFNGASYIGWAGYYDSGCGVGNRVTVTGPGSVWSNNGTLYVGIYGCSGNSLTIANGGQVFNNDAHIGWSGYNSPNIGTSNSVTVTGPGSLWSNNGSLYVGDVDVSSSLTISNGARVINGNGCIGQPSGAVPGSGSGSSVIVTGPGSVWQNNGDLSVGNASGNSLTISNGGQVSNGNATIGSWGSGSSVAVTGAGSLWNNSGTLYVGKGSGNSLTIANGGQVLSGNSYIGYSGYGSSNAVIVTGPGSLWSNSGNLYVGNASYNNSLIISNSGIVTATNVIIGAYTPNGNALTVSGGWLYATNAAASGALNVNNGTLTLNTGTVTVNQFLATNGASSVVKFNGGTLNSGSAIVSNGTPFVVGNGSAAAVLNLNGGTYTFASGLIATTALSQINFTAGMLNSGGSILNNGALFQVGNGVNSATLNLLGGTHSFVNGLLINTNAILTGTGSITGSITDAGLIAPGNGPGVITDTGNLTMLDNSRLIMELASANSALYDQLDLTGTLTFGGTLNVSLLNGYTPQWDDTFNLFGFGSANGVFSQINLPSLSRGSYWNTNLLYSSGVISVGIDFSALANVVVINGAISNYPGTYIVGSNSGFNGLIVTNAGVLISGSGVIGNSAVASTNAVLVTGAGSVWSNSGAFYAGATGSFNELTITRGGWVINTDGYVGSDANAGNNAVLVTDAGSMWSNSGSLYVGYSGDSNRLTIASGGTVTATNVVIGATPSSTSNVVIVSGGWLCVTSGLLNVNYGTLNLNSGTVTVNQFMATNGANSVVTFNGGTLNSGGTVISNGTQFVVGNGSSAATMNLVSGTNVFANGLMIAANASITNAATLITPSLAINASGLFAMNGGQILVNAVTNAGTLNQNGSVFNPAFFDNLGVLQLTGSTNAVTTLFNEAGGNVRQSGGELDVNYATNSGSWTISGAVANLTNFNDLGTLALGGCVMNVNALWVTNAGSVLSFNGGTLNSRGTVVSNGSAFIVGDTGSNTTLNLMGGMHSFSSNLVVGNSGAGNSLLITNGAQARVNGRGIIGNSAGSTNNYAVVTGPGSVWSNKSFLYVGNNGSGNSLAITNAGQVFCSTGYVGWFGNGNTATVTGPGSVWSNRGDLTVGYIGSGNSLTIANAGQVFSTTGYVGFAASANSNTATVTGPGSVWINSSFLSIGAGGVGNSLTVTNGGVVLIGGNLYAGGFGGFGGSGSNNSMTISTGGKVFNDYGYIGYDGRYGGWGDSVLVTGSGSLWSNLHDVILGDAAGIGPYSSGNSLTVTNGGVVLARNVIVGNYGSSNTMTIVNGGRVFNNYGFVGSGSDYNNALVAGPSSVWSNGANFYVGDSSSDNSLSITNGGQVLVMGTSYIGWGYGVTNNSALVAGPGSVWSNSGNLFVGEMGSGNSLIIANGARVIAGYGGVNNNSIGLESGANNNSALVTGLGSVWSNSVFLCVGLHGSGNSLAIANGGQVFSVGAEIGDWSDASNNSVLVTGTGSVWISSGYLAVGDRSSPSNSLTIANGGSVLDTIGYVGYGRDSSDNNNAVLVTGSGSVWSNSSDLYVGNNGSSNNLTIANSGKVFNAIGYVGIDGAASNNVVIVTGPGSVWSNSAGLIIGGNGSDNSLTIANGGQVFNTEAEIGYNLSASNNAVVVTGSGSAWNNSSNMFVGYLGSGNTLTIANGGKVSNINGWISSWAAGNNAVLVTGSGSVWNNSGLLNVGSSGNYNSMTVSNGGQVFSALGVVGGDDILGYGDTPSTGSFTTVLVTDVGSLWSNRGSLYVGYFGSSNSLTIASGGQVFNADGYIGYNAGSSSNTVTVTGDGSVWTNSGDLYVGYQGSSNSLVIANGGNVVNGNGFIGYDGSLGGGGNSVLVTGAGSVWSNTVALSIGQWDQVTLASGGQIDASALTIGIGGIFSMSGGNTIFQCVANAGAIIQSGGEQDVNAATNAGVWTITTGGLLEVRSNLTISSVGSLTNYSGGDVRLLSNATVNVSGSLVITNATLEFAGASTLATPFLPGITFQNCSTIKWAGYGASFGSHAITGNLNLDIPSGPDQMGGIVDNASLTVGGANGLLYVGSNNLDSLTITNGGQVLDSIGYIGFNASASNNNALVGGSGSLWSNSSLFVGYAGAGNSLTLTNGGTVSATNIVLGARASSTGNVVTVSGGNLYATNNTGGGALNVLYGTLNLNSGTVVVDRLLLTNFANSVFNFNGGVLQAGQMLSTQPLTVNGGTLSLASSFVNSTGGTFELNSGSVVVPISMGNQGWFIQNGGLFDPLVFTNSGSFVLNSGTNMDGVFLNLASGVVQQNGGEHDVNVATNYGSWAISGGMANLTNVVIDGGGVFTNAGGLLVSTNVAGNGTLDVRNGTLALFSGTVTVNQFFATNFANSVVSFNGGTLNSGGSAVNNGSIFQVGNGVSAATLDLFGGTYAFANGLFINTNAILTGTGAITGSITDAGLIAPGNGFGVITDTGDLAMLNSGTMTMELGGTNAWLYDQFDLTGALTFGGTLTVALLNGYTPQAGDHFNLFGFGSDSGAFIQTNLPTISPTLYWNTSALYSTGVIETDQATGSVQVVLAPQAAIDAGALWQVDTDGNWHTNNETVARLVVGSHTLSYTNLTGWIAPTNQTVQIAFGATTTNIGTYQLTPLLLAAVSRKTQGVETFDLNLNLNGTPSATVEPRVSGPTQLLFTFNKAMAAADGTLDATEFTLTNATFVSASIVSSNLTLNLTSVVDQSKVTVVMNGLTDLAGNPLSGTNAVLVRSLYGDVNQSGTVNGVDLQQVKNNLLTTLTPANFLCDVNCSGTINAVDLQQIKNNLLHSASLADSGTAQTLSSSDANSSLTTLALSTTTLGEALGATNLTWSTNGDAPWTPTIAEDGSQAAWSGSIGNLNVSWVETTVTGPGTLSFDWMVSSELNGDYLTFAIDGVDHPGAISGEMGWQTLTFAIPAGTHRLTWTYSKNGATTSGLDAGWLRRVVYR